MPNDNPFFDGAGSNNDYIWTRGFRNPFTFTWRPETEQLWVNTVGTSYEQVFVVGSGDHAGWTAYENNQPPPFIRPVIAYRTNDGQIRTIAAMGASRSARVATFTITTSDHGFPVGTKVTIADVGDPSFNGDAYVTAVPAFNMFQIAQAGPNAPSGGGTATSLNIAEPSPAALSSNRPRCPRHTVGISSSPISTPAAWSAPTFSPDGNMYIIGRDGLSAFDDCAGQQSRVYCEAPPHESASRRDRLGLVFDPQRLLSLRSRRSSGMALTRSCTSQLH